MDALTADEIQRAVEILRSAGRAEADAKFATLTLRENDKADVRAWRSGQAFARRAFAVVMQRGAVYEAIVDLGTREVASWREVEGVQPRLLRSEMDVNAVLWESEDWQAAMARRGYDRDSRTFCAPLSPGPSLPP
jgi:primary-amine oxidase